MLLDNRCPANSGIGENVELVAAARGELGDNRAIVASLETVQRVWRDRGLLAGMQRDFVPDGVGMLAPRRRLRGWIIGRYTLDVQGDEALAGTEGFLFTRRIFDGGGTMFGAGLAGEQYQLLRTNTLSINVDDQLQTGCFQVAKPKVESS